MTSSLAKRPIRVIKMRVSEQKAWLAKTIIYDEHGHAVIKHFHYMTNYLGIWCKILQSSNFQTLHSNFRKALFSITNF